MSWPTTGAGSLSSGYLASGVTTIRWGSDELVQSLNAQAVSSFLIVTRFSERNLVDNIKLPNGDGLTSTRVMIVDGVQWDVTVRDSTAITGIPKIGTQVTVVDAAGLIDAVGEVYTATVVDSGYETAPKQAGERTLVLENLVLIESQSGSAQA